MQMQIYKYIHHFLTDYHNKSNKCANLRILEDNGLNTQLVLVAFESTFCMIWSAFIHMHRIVVHEMANARHPQTLHAALISTGLLATDGTGHHLFVHGAHTSRPVHMVHRSTALGLRHRHRLANVLAVVLVLQSDAAERFGRLQHQMDAGAIGRGRGRIGFIACAFAEHGQLEAGGAQMVPFDLVPQPQLADALATMQEDDAVGRGLMVGWVDGC